MKITSSSKQEIISLPVPIYSSIKIADAIDKDGIEYAMFVGIDEKYVQQLKELSLDKSDTAIQNNTGDRRRFGEGSYEEWYKKNRTPFVLIDKQKDVLAAIIWFGPKSLGKKSLKFGEESKDVIQNEWHTVVWRCYPMYRGRGLMKAFSQYVMGVYKEQFLENIKFWAGMDNRNDAMVSLSLKLGFKADMENSDLKSNWLVVVKDA
ncbi:MAG: hypothetical protein Q7T51_03310 [Candidatus Moranbacteria bacterium]|nr:hypothetical protein [Candidatus Moranbacteria bacterium]